ncbi:hypothetical protein AAE478_009289 [Parahypoxylon ruwenzoriense]
MPAALEASGGFFKVPEVSPADIDSFHNAHFSLASVQLFETQFLRPENAQDGDQLYEDDKAYYEELDDYDDGLGYYPDGVKRTLTDEQIAIFRHSELEALRRVEAKAAKLRQESAALLQAAKEEDAAKLSAEPIATSSPTAPAESHREGTDTKGEEAQDGSEDGEIEMDIPKPTKAEARRLKKLRARRKKQEQRKFNPEKKPDLRKRTWDVVEAGMDSLDYDELETARNATAAPAAQRRQISYDD